MSTNYESKTIETNWRFPLDIPRAWALLCASLFCAGNTSNLAYDVVETAKKFDNYIRTSKE